MNKPIEIVRKSILKQETWRFILVNGNLVVESYKKEERTSRKDKFRLKKTYLRMPTHFSFLQTTAKNVPLPSKVKSKAKAKLLANLKIKVR